MWKVIKLYEANHIPTALIVCCYFYLLNLTYVNYLKKKKKLTYIPDYVQHILQGVWFCWQVILRVGTPA